VIELLQMAKLVDNDIILIFFRKMNNPVAEIQTVFDFLVLENN